MSKYKFEILLITLLTPILTYVGWQVYTTYIKPPEIEISGETENTFTETAPVVPLPEKEIKPEEKIEPIKPVEKENTKAETPPVSTVSASTKGTLDETGYSKRDPLKPALPVKEKKKETTTKTQEPPKEIIPPTFAVSGITWGEVPPRVILDNQVYKIGDVIKGATILEITDRGAHMIYEGKEFWVNVQK